MNPTNPHFASKLRKSAGLLTAFGLAAAAAGCNCQVAPLKRVGPIIKVTPNPIVFASTVVGVGANQTVKVQNTGTSVLVFKATPTVIMKTPVPNPVFAVLPGSLTQNCDGSAAASATQIEPGGCSILTLRYLPVDTADNAAVLRFTSNDEIDPFDVPIVAQGLIMHVNVCLEDSGTETCNADGQPLTVDFGSMVQVGTTATKSLVIKSSGGASAQIETMGLWGDSTFTTTPPAGSFAPTMIPTNATWPFSVAYSPIVGGPNSGVVKFDTQDPLNLILVVNITAVAAGPGICTCVGSASVPCHRSTVADFGSVGTGATGNMFMEISSCGTEPLNLTSVALSSGAPVFGAMNLPAANTMLAPTDMPITIPLTFSPAALMSYMGTISIQSSAGEGVIDLTGTGVIAGCSLSGAPSVNFGSVAVGVQGQKAYAVSNRGTEPCHFPVGNLPAITTGAPLFQIVTAPTTDIPPGGSAVFTLGYTPSAVDAGDMGQLSINSVSSLAPTGTAPTLLTVALSGTPAAQATCVLQAVPSANSLFGRLLNFGQVRIGTTETLPATFRNVGSANCTLQQAKLIAGIMLTGGSDISAFRIAQQPATSVAPGATTTLEVAFTPTAQTTYGSALPIPGFPSPPGFSDAVQVQTSDHVTFDGSDCPMALGGNGPVGCVGWALSGEGVTSDLVVLPSAINFGQTTLGCESAEETITLYNIGQIAIHVTGFKVDPAPPPTIFSVIAAAVPITINAGQSTTIRVRYSPSQLGTETGTLYIESDATNGTTSGSNSNPYVTVSLQGSGTSDSMQTDTFIEPDHPTVDVLWVIDQDSDSMSDKIAAIASNAQAFIQTAQNQNTDFHLAVVSINVGGNLTTTTSPIPGSVLSSGCGLANASDTCGSSYGGETLVPGQFYHKPGGPDWVSSTDANPVQEFTDYVQIGVCDAVTGNETGLAAMYATLSAPNITGANAGFLRDDAKLVVITISDDDDVPPDLSNPIPTAFYTAFLKSLKPNNPQNVVFDMVGGDMPNGCTNGVDGDAPDRYDDVVMGTGGQLYSICTGNYSQIASDLGLGSFSGQTSFMLTRPCDPTTLSVTVNGTALMQGGGYTFNAMTNSINLTTLPPPGATIVATYGTVCM